MRCSPGSADAVQQNEMQSRKSGVHRQWSTARMVDRPDNRTVYVYRPGAPVQTLVERNSEIDTTVGAVCDRAQSLSFGKMRGHRPRLQKLWYQIHCYAPLDVTTGCQFVAGTGRHIPERVRSRFVSFLCRPF